MGKAVTISSFGSQTLSNSTNFKQQSVIDSGSQPRDSLYETINGVWFDAAGSDDNTLVPGTVSVTIKVTGTSAANYKANTNSIDALNGTKDTLTGAYADATTVTCTARCRVEAVETKTDSHLIPMSVYTLTFRKLTNWA